MATSKTRVPHLRIVERQPTLDDLRRLSFIYLASSYTSHPDGTEAAHYETCQLVIKLHAQKIFGLYSPILHFHDVAYYGSLPTDAAFWKQENGHKLRISSALLVAEMPGWDKPGNGVAGEIADFKPYARPIFYIDPASLELRK